MSWAVAAAGFGAGLVAALLADRAATALARARSLPDSPLRGRRTILLVVLPLLFGACGLRFGENWMAPVAMAICAVLVLLAVVDLEQRIVPNDVVLPAALATVVARTLLSPSLEWVVAAAAVAGVLFVAALIQPAGIGMGDVKLGLLVGAATGWDAVVALLVSFLLVLPVALGLIVRHGSRGRKMGIPFAPFLAAGGIVGLLLRGV